MNNKIRDNNESKKCLDMLFNDCFYKLFDKNIMVDDEFHLSARKNKLSLTNMPLVQRIIVIDSMREILNYNSDFNEIGINFLLDLRNIPNISNIHKFIKSQYRYYYYKAIIIAIIKTLLIIIQLIFSIIIFYPKNGCINSPIETERCELCCLKLVYFFFFDLFYIINEFYFFKEFERIKMNKNTVVFYQILGYICNRIIYLLILFSKKNAREDDNAFYKKDYYIEIIISMLFDVIKFFIK